MAKITGIGGVFFKSRDPMALRRWYEEHLGLPSGFGEGPAVALPFAASETGRAPGYAVWGPFSNTTSYFEPSERDFMVNFRVDDLEGLLASLRDKGVEVLSGPIDEKEGRFAWIVDPEGTKIELWQPSDLDVTEPGAD